MFSQFSASGFSMATRRATLRCVLISFCLGSGIVRAGSVLGHVRLPGIVLNGQLVSEVVNTRLEMGRAGTVLFSVCLVHPGSLWWRGLVMLRYGLFSFCGWAQASCKTDML